MPDFALTDGEREALTALANDVRESHPVAFRALGRLLHECGYTRPRRRRKRLAYATVRGVPARGGAFYLEDKEGEDGG